MPKPYRSALMATTGRPPPYAWSAMSRAEGLPPGVYVTEVAHDPDCAIFKAQPCTCSPSVGPPLPAPV